MKKIAIIISLSLLVLVTSCTKEESAALKLKGVWEATYNDIVNTFEFSNIKKDGGDFSYKSTYGSFSQEVNGIFTVKDDATTLSLEFDNAPGSTTDLEIVELDNKTLMLKSSGSNSIITYTKK